MANETAENLILEISFKESIRYLQMTVRRASIGALGRSCGEKWKDSKGSMALHCPDSHQVLTEVPLEDAAA